jgi:hypothetical protein
MKSSNISFYFVLYLVAVITLFVITTERDALLRERDDDIAHLIEIYVKPLHLSAYVDTTRYFIEPREPHTKDSVRIRLKADGPIDKGDIVFSLVSASTLDPGHDDARLTQVRNEDGDGLLVSPPLGVGVYAFTVAGYKRRIVPDGDKVKVLIRDTTYAVQFSPRLAKVDRDTVVLYARVEESGVTPPQLTLSVEEAQSNWVFGTPFSKRVFVSGLEDTRRATYSIDGPGRVVLPERAESYVTFIWDQPALGRRAVAITANANRGLGSLDIAKTAFSLEVYPPAFVTAPAEKAYWGIPYVFDGRIAGLSPLDLSVELSRDGQVLHTRPVVPPDTVTAERTWTSALFRILFRGGEVKSHRVTFAAPPPPQIRWILQSIDRDRNKFVVTAAAADPLGGPVLLSIQSEPSGIAQLDKIRGTSFVISIDLQNKPNAVFLKLTATDKYGGRSASAKQFNIPQ